MRYGMKCYTSGIDIFSSDPKKPAKTDIRCRACGALLTGEKHNRYGSWASAMAKVKSWAWDYYCPHVGKKDHEHLVDLVKEAEDTVSKKVRALIESELKEERRKFNGQV